MNKYIRVLFCGMLALFAIAKAEKAFATHFYGSDFYYTWQSGNTYKVTLVVYGDCSGSAFSSLSGATPEVEIYNGSTYITTINLSQQGLPVEVTPVCPAQQGQTVCTIPTSTIPGVKRYIYSANYTVSTTSANWKFRFTGTMSSTGSAGRSSTITNILNPGSSVTALEALLNNTVLPQNSSPTYTTIPTPFFCINKPANYNPGAVDPNGDSLSFALVAGLTPTGTVTYTGTGITASTPLTTSTGSFSVSATTGQVTFTPNAVQRSLVVSRVTEYRNGVQVGTSMREMTFVVLGTCNNNPPVGVISNTSTGLNTVDTVTVKACQSVGLLTFNINPTDLDGDSILLSWAGLPTGASFTVVGNNTTSPSGSFSWNVSSVTPGSYTFFITYKDNGCPLASQQTMSYTIVVLPLPKVHFTLVSPTTCTAKEVFTLTPYNATSPYSITIGSTTFNNVTGAITDSLSPGTYTVHLSSGNTCTFDTSITIPPAPSIHANVSMVRPVCFGGNNGSITVTGTNGLTPYQYAFGSGVFSSTNTYTGLSAGSYMLHIKDAGACTLDTLVTLPDTAEIHATVTFTKPPCNHFSNGSMTISGFNSIAPYTYALGSGAYQASGTFTGLYSGNYTVHIKNAAGCIKDTLIVLPDSVKISVTSLPITNVSCFGGSDGAATINVTGAYGPPYTYAIGAGTFGTSNIFTSLTAGNYTLHVVDTEGCYLDTAIVITQPPVIVVTPTVNNNLTCNGGNDGGATITATGGTPGYTYKVDAGTYGASNVFTTLIAGSHTAYVKDSHGCIVSATFTLTQPPPIVIGWTLVQPQCSYSSDGSFTLSGSGGTPGYTYSVDGLPYQASGTITGLAGGSHTLHVKDANGCIKDSVVTLTTPAPIVPTASVKKSTCVTLGDGKVILSATGGTPGYTYAMGTGAYGASSTFTPLAAGTYTFHVKDTHGCIKDTTITITDSLIISGNVTVTNAACNAQSSGAINVTGTGGQNPYTYALGSGTFGTSGTFSTLPAGPYVLHIKDNNGCQKDTNLTITQPTRIKPAATLVHVTCNGGTNGSITVTATNGTPGYTFANGTGTYQTSGVFTGLAAGTYIIHTKDTNGCIIDTSLTITQPTPVAYTLVVTNVLCNGGSTGQVTVNATGGTPGYTYTYDAGTYGAGNILTGFNAGSHTIHVKDANGCIKDSTLTITEPLVLKMGYTATQPLCNAGSDGTITITGSGGTTAYQFAVNTGAFQASGSFTGIAAGSYVLHLKDAHGCTVDSNITIGQPTAIVVTAGIKRPRCTPLVNGAVTIYASGGSPGYTYANGAGTYQTSNIFNGLGSGTYTFHTKDSHGCIKDTTITVSDSVFVHAQLAITNTTCYDTSNGAVQITPSGGDAPYKYRIQPNPFATTNPITGIHAGSYTLSVKDSNGCVLDTALTITQPTVVAPNVVITQPTCYGFSNGSIQLNATGGTPGYTYGISTGAYGSNNLFTGLPAGIDTLHVKDINGCKHDTIVTIGQPTPLLITQVAISNVKCYGDNSGYVVVTATGATPAYTYAADANAYGASNTVSGLNVGAHTIHVRDANSCQKDTTVTLTQPALLVLDSIKIIRPTCEGYPDGTITVNGRGGTKQYVFSTDGLTFDTVRTFRNLVEGTYKYWVKDSQNCVHDTTINLIGYPHIVIGGASVANPLCYGDHNGSIQLNVTGGNPMLTYQLVRPIRLNNTGYFDSLKKGTYQILIKDSTSCHKDTTIVLTEPDLLQAHTEVKPNDCIGLDNEGGATVVVTGGTGPYKYLWNTNPAQTTASIAGTANGTFKVMVTDDHGCADSSVAKVTYDDCCKPFLPDAFTPNNDGRNDVFRIRFKGDVSKLQFSVYDRFGQRVWYTENINVGWDGTYLGKPLDGGVYMYYIKFYCGNKEDNLVEYKGDVTLIR